MIGLHQQAPLRCLHCVRVVAPALFPEWGLEGKGGVPGAETLSSRPRTLLPVYRRKQSRGGNILTEVSLLVYLEPARQNLENVQVCALACLLKSREFPKTGNLARLQFLH